MDKMLDPLAENVMAWLDDLLSHAKTEQELLEITTAFSELCRQHNLLLHAEKVEVLKTATRW